MAFDKELDKVLRERLRQSLLKEDRRPSEGVWYVIWLKPKWVLRAFRETEYPDISHMKAWEEYLSHEVANHYGLDYNEIKTLVYAFPRGRAVYLQRGSKPFVSRSEMTGKWVFYYGGDLPGSESRWMRLIVSAFNLDGMVGRMEWSTRDDHEYMQRLDVDGMVALIGPYLDKGQLKQAK